ncbi:MAG: S8 family serine peptidase [Gemmatimonadetes bacterium]|nr:S8 family serine peptidase [Gemmatimonadota bacterium]
MTRRDVFHIRLLDRTRTCIIKSLNFRLLVAVLSLCVVTEACTRPDQETPPLSGIVAPAAQVDDYVAADGRVFVIKAVPSVTVDMPVPLRDYDTSSDALARAVAAGGGSAIVAFKAPSDVRALANNGRRPALAKTTLQSGLALLEERKVEIVDYLAYMGAAWVHLKPEDARALMEHPLVDYIQPDHVGKAAGGPGIVAGADMDVAQQIPPWGIAMVRAPQAWTIETGSGTTDWQIVDSGYDNGHEDLAVLNANDQCRAGGCNDAFPSPHGSHVAGIATARDNFVGVVGVAHGLTEDRIFSYRACNNIPGNACTANAVTTGINYAVPNIDVLNLSLVLRQDFALCNAVAQAWQADVVIVAAAGNNSETLFEWPARCSNVVGVSGVLPNRNFASTSPCTVQGGTIHSNSGNHVDIAAPFYALSTVPNGYQGEMNGWCGTSQATPHVSGAAVLVRERFPSWSNLQVVNYMFQAADDEGPPGKDNQYGWGILNAYEAVK